MVQEEYQKSSENLNLFLVFQLNIKKCQEPLLRVSNMLLSQSYHGKPSQSSGFRGYCPGALVWWTYNNPKLPVPKEKNIFLWLVPPKLFC